MDSGAFRALARRYADAAGEAIDSRSRVASAFETRGAGWTGERRSRFDPEYAETLNLYRQYAEDLLRTSEELRRAADRIDETRRELERQERLRQEALERERLLRSRRSAAEGGAAT